MENHRLGQVQLTKYPKQPRIWRYGIFFIKATSSRVEGESDLDRWQGTVSGVAMEEQSIISNF